MALSFSIPQFDLILNSSTVPNDMTIDTELVCAVSVDQMEALFNTQNSVMFNANSFGPTGSTAVCDYSLYDFLVMQNVYDTDLTWGATGSFGAAFAAIQPDATGTGLYPSLNIGYISDSTFINSNFNVKSDTNIFGSTNNILKYNGVEAVLMSYSNGMTSQVRQDALNIIQLCQADGITAISNDVATLGNYAHKRIAKKIHDDITDLDHPIAQILYTGLQSRRVDTENVGKMGWALDDAISWTTTINPSNQTKLLYPNIKSLVIKHSLVVKDEVYKWVPVVNTSSTPLFNTTTTFLTGGPANTYTSGVFQKYVDPNAEATNWVGTGSNTIGQLVFSNIK
jgi:hypothetical protein